MIIKLLTKDSGGLGPRIAFAAALSGMASAGLVAIINEAAAGTEYRDIRLFFLFLLACVVYTIYFRSCVSATSTVIQTMLQRTRIRLANKIRHADLHGLEKIGISEIHEHIFQQMTAISNASWPLANGLQSAVRVIFIGGYLFTLSTEAFLITAAGYVGGPYIYSLRRAKIQAILRRCSAVHLRLTEGLTDFLRGAKETRMRRQQSDALYQEFQHTASSLGEKTIEADILQQDNTVFANLNQFFLLGLVVFVLPQFVKPEGQLISQIAAGILFLYSPVGNILNALPEYERTKVAAEKIYELESKLDKWNERFSEASIDPWQGDFRELRILDLQFQYVDNAGQTLFKIGPLNLTISAGEMVFIVGDNGSGKSTLVKLLTALYFPSSGQIYLNNICVQPSNTQAYRDMFSVVFADFYLFKKLYGFNNIDSEGVQRLLKKMQLDNKTSILDGRFTNLDLSTGQRKRLAMVVAMLEDRPVYVFDEWAADQDPVFRKLYYEELLPDLKKRGKTVIAICHDEKYFHCADRVIEMDYGKIGSV